MPRPDSQRVRAQGKLPLEANRCGFSRSVFSSDNKDRTVRKKDDAAIKEVVHHQAEYLRSLVKQNKLPDAYGHLTLEQIDEMEKNSILIE